MATFKECIDSGRPFRHGNKPWFLFDAASGNLKRADGQGGMGNYADMLTTFLALSDKWEIQEAPAEIRWVRPALMWHKDKRAYLEGRSWFQSLERARATLHPSIVVIKWEEWLAPDLSTVYPPQ